MSAMSDLPCPACGCRATDAAAAHAVAAALRIDDVDGALEAGLLQVAPCAQCDGACTQRLLAARAERERALAARERHRARQARLQARALARERARAVPAAPAGDLPAPALPGAAAAALARAKARAAQRHKP